VEVMTHRGDHAFRPYAETECETVFLHSKNDCNYLFGIVKGSLDSGHEVQIMSFFTLKMRDLLDVRKVRA
jgi:hypothetical protein